MMFQDKKIGHELLVQKLFKIREVNVTILFFSLIGGNFFFILEPEKQLYSE